MDFLFVEVLTLTALLYSTWWFKTKNAKNRMCTYKYIAITIICLIIYNEVHQNTYPQIVTKYWWMKLSSRSCVILPK